MGFSEGFSAMQKVAEMVGSKMPKETKTLDDVWGQSTNPLGFLFSKLIEYAVNQIMSIFGSKAQKVAATVQKIKRKGQKLVKLVEKIINAVKKIIQIFKAIAKAVMTVVKPIIMLYTTPWVCFVAWGVTLVIIVLLFFAILFGRFGSFQGEFMINLDKMQELNQDEQEYTDLLNTGALREAFYQSISDTSFYQTFNLTDMDGAQTNLATLVVTDLASKLSGKTYTSEDILAQQKCTTSSTPSCVYANGNLLQLFTYSSVEQQYGVVIKVIENDNVVATLNGTVVYTNHEMSDVYTIIIKHTNYLSIYRGLKKMSKKVGDLVQMGESIGLTSSHNLEFELWKNDQPIDPEKLIVF